MLLGNPDEDGMTAPVTYDGDEVTVVGFIYGEYQKLRLYCSTSYYVYSRK